MDTKLYKEKPNAGNKYREAMLEQVQTLVRKRQDQADVNRQQYFKPDFSSLHTYEQSLSKYRSDLINLLGWPLTERASGNVPDAKRELVGEDRLGTISRMWIDTLPGVSTYGLYFRPHGSGPFPFAISQHGGNGTPEYCSGLTGSSNYNNMTRGVLEKGIAVFAPQLLTWDTGSFGPNHNRDTIDRRLKQTGGSLSALELYRIIRSLDYFAAHKDIDRERMGMIGLSYGGFYTLYAAALDTRLKAAVSSCFFNNRYVYDFGDWVLYNAANKFMDAEVGALVCPRQLYIEVGKKDELFDVKYAGTEAGKLQAVYDKLNISDSFCYKEFEGCHELDKSGDGIDFLCRHLAPRE